MTSTPFYLQVLKILGDSDCRFTARTIADIIYNETESKTTFGFADTLTRVRSALSQRVSSHRNGINTPFVHSVILFEAKEYDSETNEGYYELTPNGLSAYNFHFVKELKKKCCGGCKSGKPSGVMPGGHSVEVKESLSCVGGSSSSSSDEVPDELWHEVAQIDEDGYVWVHPGGLRGVLKELLK